MDFSVQSLATTCKLTMKIFPNDMTKKTYQKVLASGLAGRCEPTLVKDESPDVHCLDLQ